MKLSFLMVLFGLGSFVLVSSSAQAATLNRSEVNQTKLSYDCKVREANMMDGLMGLVPAQKLELTGVPLGSLQASSLSCGIYTRIVASHFVKVFSFGSDELMYLGKAAHEEMDQAGNSIAIADEGDAILRIRGSGDTLTGELLVTTKDTTPENSYVTVFSVVFQASK